MDNLPRSALLTLVAGVTTAGASLTLASQAENVPRRRDPDIPLVNWLLPTIVLTFPTIICCCMLPLCCSILYRAALNIRSNRDGVEMTDQRAPRQSITEQRAEEALRIVVGDLSNPEGSLRSFSSDSSSSSPEVSRHSSLSASFPNSIQRSR